MDTPKQLTNKVARAKKQPPATPEVYQVLIECRSEEEQRELFERLRSEGRKVKLLVL